MKAITLYRHNSEKNMHRFYKMMLQLDLFGNCCVIREWGRIGRAGRVKEEVFAREEEAIRLWERKKREKLRKQYRE